MNKIIAVTLILTSSLSLTACGESDPDILNIQDTKPGFMMGKTYKEGFEDWRVCDSITWEKTKDDITRMYKGKEIIRVTCDVANIDGYNQDMRAVLLKLIKDNPKKATELQDREMFENVTAIKSIKLSLYFRFPSNQKPQPYAYANHYEWKDGKTGLLTVRPQAIARDMENQWKNFTEITFGTNYITPSKARAVALLYNSMRNKN